MIPFALLSGKITTSKGQNLEISLLELSSDSFTFRLPKGELTEGVKLPLLVLSFWNQAERIYRKVTLRDLVPEKITSPEVEEEIEIFRIDIVKSDTMSGATNPTMGGYGEQQKDYSEEVKRFSRMYLQYVESKTMLSDEEHAANYSRYPVEEGEFWGSRKEQLQYVRNKVTVELFAAKKGVSFGIALQSPKQMEEYCHRSRKEFLEKYFGVERAEKPLLNQFRKIQLGNSFCPNCYPDEELLQRALEKAKDEGLEVTIALAPTSESLWNKQVERLFDLNHLAEERGITITVEVNDYGILLEGEKFSNLKMEKGILFYKKKKDAREKYLGNEAVIWDETQSHIYYPYYQMNTGTFCPVQAMKYGGARGNQWRVTTCNKECEGEGFLYPRHLEMMGRFNSVFGYTLNLQAVIKGTQLWEEKIIMYNL